METLTAVEISKVDLSKLEDGIYLTNLGNRLLSTSPINGRRLYQGEEPLGVITHLYLPTPLVLDEERVINLITKIVYQNSTDDSTSIRITFEKVDYIINEIIQGLSLSTNTAKGKPRMCNCNNPIIIPQSSFCRRCFAVKKIDITEMVNKRFGHCSYAPKHYYKLGLEDMLSTIQSYNVQNTAKEVEPDGWIYNDMFYPDYLAIDVCGYTDEPKPVYFSPVSSDKKEIKDWDEAWNEFNKKFNSVDYDFVDWLKQNYTLPKQVEVSSEEEEIKHFRILLENRDAYISTLESKMLKSDITDEEINYCANNVSGGIAGYKSAFVRGAKWMKESLVFDNSLNKKCNE